MIARNIYPFLVILIVGLLLLTSSCEDKIDFAIPEDTSEALAIEGRIIMGMESKVEVIISQVFDFTASGRNILEAEEIYVENDDGHTFPLRQVENGVAQRVYKATIPDNDKFIVAVGKKYRLHVTDSNGISYVSDYSLMTSADDIEGVYIKKVKELRQNEIGDYVDQERYQISVDVADLKSNNTSGLLFEFSGVNQLTDRDGNVCYISRLHNTQELPLFTFDQAGNGEKEREVLLFDPNYFHHEKMYYTIHQYSLDEAALNYHEQLLSLQEFTGSLFDNPQGRTTTNFKTVSETSKDVFGHFYATSKDSILLKIDQEFTGNVGLYCPQVLWGCPIPLPESDGCCLAECGWLQAKDCCCCINLVGASYTPPHYWE